MFPIEAFQRTLGKFVRVFEGLGIAFHLTGGLTSIAYAEPRLTQDIDIVVDNERLSTCLGERLPLLRKADFLFDEAALRSAVAQRRLFQLLDMARA